jgi:WD40 repeat protein
MPIWDVHTSGPVTIFNADSVSDICFSADGSRLVIVMSRSGLNQLWLWDVATGEWLASIEVETSFTGRPSISLNVDGTHVILRLADKTMRWRLSPAPTPSHESSINTGTSSLSSPRMDFVPIHDTELPTPPDVSPRHQYHRDLKREWILDRQDRRVLWIASDLRQEIGSYEEMVAIGSTNRRVLIAKLYTS